jgi:hypothetical protein
MVPAKNVPFTSYKALKKQTAGCIGAEDPSSSQHCQKLFDKNRSPPKPKNPHFKTQ